MNQLLDMFTTQWLCILKYSFGISTNISVKNTPQNSYFAWDGWEQDYK